MKIAGSLDRPRWTNIDALRGVAALFVLVLHAAEVSARWAVPLPAEAWALGWMEQLHIGLVGVVAFFCISGFLIPTTMRNDGRRPVAVFLVKRAARLYPAFIVAALAPAAFYVFVQGRNQPLDALLAQMTMVPSLFGQPFLIGHFWTLQVEWIFYGLTLLLFIAGLTGSTWVMLVVSSLLIVIVIGPDIVSAPLLAHIGTIGPLDYSDIVLMIMSLGLMFWAWAFRLVLDGCSTMRLVSAAVWAAGLAYAVGLPLAGIVALAQGQGEVAKSMFGYGLGVALFLATIAVRRGPDILQPLGRWSYSIYLFHPLPLHLLDYAIMTQRLPVLGMTATVLIVAAATCVIAALVYRFIELPFMAIGRRRAKMLASPAAAVPSG
jgi:peptidoglycan/LPS O-acetylase OafA/YrhL